MTYSKVFGTDRSTKTRNTQCPTGRTKQKKSTIQNMHKNEKNPMPINT